MASLGAADRVRGSAAGGVLGDDGNRPAGPHRALLGLPANMLRHILLDATVHDNILLHVAVCSMVCPEWRRLVMDAASYGLSCPDGMLREITGMLGKTELTYNGHFADVMFDDDAAAVLGAALRARPSPLPYTRVSLTDTKIEVAGLTSLLAGAVGPPPPERTDMLRSIIVDHNPQFGDAGVCALAGGLPPTLETLDVRVTRCGDEGLAAVAAAIPATRLQTLRFANNVVGPAGWAALCAALPLLPALRYIDGDGNVLGDGGAVALAASLARATPGLRELDVRDNHVWGSLPRDPERVTAEEQASPLFTAGAKALLAATKKFPTISLRF